MSGCRPGACEATAVPREAGQGGRKRAGGRRVRAAKKIREGFVCRQKAGAGGVR